MRRNGPKMFLFGLIIVALFGALVLVLWNLIVPAVFGLPALNFWQATGLFLLGRVFFGSFGGRHRMMWHNKMHGHHDNPIHEKWRKMTPEQRREFINKRRRFGVGPFTGRDFFDPETFDGNETIDTGNKNEQEG